MAQMTINEIQVKALEILHGDRHLPVTIQYIVEFNDLPDYMQVGALCMLVNRVLEERDEARRLAEELLEIIIDIDGGYYVRPLPWKEEVRDGK